MALHTDLLVQAQLLATKEPKRPKQASLRRAVSAAYYALFHFLIDKASRFLVSGNSVARTSLRQQLAREFDHGGMKTASQAFAGSGKNAWKDLPGLTLPQDLVDIANAFIALQQQRHHADYNLSRTFTRSGVTTNVTQAADAIKKWNSVRDTPGAEAYLLALLTKGRS